MSNQHKRDRLAEIDTRAKAFQESTPNDTTITTALRQAVVLFVGCAPSQGDIRYTGTGFGYKPLTGRHIKFSGNCLDYFRKIVVDGQNPGNSLWGSDIITLHDEQERDQRAREKLHEILKDVEFFADVYVQQGENTGADWADPFADWMDGAVPRRGQANAGKRKEPPAAEEGLRRSGRQKRPAFKKRSKATQSEPAAARSANAESDKDQSEDEEDKRVEDDEAKRDKQDADYAAEEGEDADSDNDHDDADRKSVV